MNVCFTWICYLARGTDFVTWTWVLPGSVSLKVAVSEDLKEGEWNGIGARR